MLNIGWASRDVSTKEPVFISGQHHERISKGSCDPTTITVLVIDDGKIAEQGTHRELIEKKGIFYKLM